MSEPNKREIALLRKLRNSGLVKIITYLPNMEYGCDITLIDGVRPEKWCLEWLRKRGYTRCIWSFLDNEVLMSISHCENVSCELPETNFTHIWDVVLSGTTDLECLLSAVLKIAKGEK